MNIVYTNYLRGVKLFDKKGNLEIKTIKNESSYCNTPCAYVYKNQTLNLVDFSI